VVFAPFAFAGTQAHCLARLAARFYKQSCRAGFGTRRAFAFRTPSLQNQRCGVIVALWYPSSGTRFRRAFWVKQKFFIIEKSFFRLSAGKRK